MLRWLGEWFNGSGWPSTITTACEKVLQNLLWKHLICQDKTCPPAYSCIFCSRLPSFLTCSLSLIMPSAPNSDKHRWRLWALVLDFQLCVLQLVRRVRCGDYRPWNVRLNVCPGVLFWTMWTTRCQTFSSLGFFCREALFCCVENKIEKRRGGLCGLPNPSSGILL